MKKRYLMTVLFCSAALAFSMAVPGMASAEETEGMTEAAMESTEAETGEADSEEESAGEEGAQEETEEPVERPDYQALDYVTLGDYKGLKVSIDPEEFVIVDQEIEDAIRKELQEADLFEEITEGQVQDGDIANIDFEGKLDGEAFDGNSGQGYDLEIGSGTFIDGFEEGLIGAAIGGTVDLPLTFPENYGSEDLAGQDVVFTVTVNSVKRMPELTDELANTVSEGTYPDEASYRAHMEEEIQADKDSIKENRIFSELLNLIANSSEVSDYPEELVEYSKENMRSYYRDYAEAYGFEYADFLEVFLGTTEEEFEAQMDTAVKQNIRQEMFLKAIAETEKIELTEEEFATGCQKYAEEYGYKTEEELLENYEEKIVRLSLLQDKVMRFVMDNAVIEEITETETESEM